MIMNALQIQYEQISIFFVVIESVVKSY